MVHVFIFNRFTSEGVTCDDDQVCKYTIDSEWKVSSDTLWYFLPLKQERKCESDMNFYKMLIIL